MKTKSLFLLTLISFILLVLTAQAQEQKTVNNDHFVYLPIVVQPVQPSKGLTGKVTFNGNPVANVLLLVQKYNGTSWETAAEIQTGQDGIYSYTAASTLFAGQWYAISYFNSRNSFNPDWLDFWSTRAINSYAQGEEVLMGDFDLADINLQMPGDLTFVNLPYTFTWDMRGLLTDESYGIEISGYQKTPYSSGELGQTGSFTLNEGDLADDHFSGINSNWHVAIYRDDGSRGASQSRPVYFRR